jgi:hypothetical protein
MGLLMMKINNINPTKYYEIPNSDGKYQINFYAEIRKRNKKGYRQLGPYAKCSNGKMAIKINGKEKTISALMRDTFMGPIPSSMVVYHKNGIKTDNCLANLEVITRSEAGRRTGRRNESEIAVVKLNSDGEIIDFYRSAREAGRKNFMSYQTILDRVNGKVKSLFAPDGCVYVKEDERSINKAVRKIELANGYMPKAPIQEFEF